MNVYQSKLSVLVGILFGALALLPSCSNEADTPDIPTATVASTSVIESSKVTKANAIDVASIFNESRFGKTTSRSSQTVEVVANQMGAPMAYVVNQEDGGWVMVSATKNYHPILAYSDDANGRFDLSSGRAFTGLGIWLDEIAADMEASDSFTEEQSAQIAAEWSQLENEAQTLASGLPTGNSPEAVQCRNRLKELNDAYYKDGWTFTTLPNVNGVTLPNDVYTTADNVGSPYEYTIVGLKDLSETSQTGPLLTTTWSQYYGTNNPTGCVPVAMAQIMKYYRYPTSFDWNNMPNSTETLATRELIDAIMGALGTTDNNSNNLEAVNAFHHFGYATSFKEHNNSDVINAIIQSRPVYMSGVSGPGAIGHAWVCDGVQTTSTENQYYVEYLNSETEYTNYGNTFITNPGSCGTSSHSEFHMNWGEGGDYNGWYVNPIIITGQSTYPYTYNRQNIYVTR